MDFTLYKHKLNGRIILIESNADFDDYGLEKKYWQLLTM